MKIQPITTTLKNKGNISFGKFKKTEDGSAKNPGFQGELQEAIKGGIDGYIPEPEGRRRPGGPLTSVSKIPSLDYKA